MTGCLVTCALFCTVGENEYVKNSDIMRCRIVFFLICDSGFVKGASCLGTRGTSMTPLYGLSSHDIWDLYDLFLVSIFQADFLYFLQIHYELFFICDLLCRR